MLRSTLILSTLLWMTYSVEGQISIYAGPNGEELQLKTISDGSAKIEYYYYIRGEVERKHGDYSLTYNNGNIGARGQFFDGDPDGYWEESDQDGEKIYKGFYNRGIKDSTWLFYIDGTLDRKVTYKDGKEQKSYGLDLSILQPKVQFKLDTGGKSEGEVDLFSEKATLDPLLANIGFYFFREQDRRLGLNFLIGFTDLKQKAKLKVAKTENGIEITEEEVGQVFLYGISGYMQVSRFIRLEIGGLKGIANSKFANNDDKGLYGGFAIPTSWSEGLTEKINDWL